MTTSIDSTTGLPELPEGHFWRLLDDINFGLKLEIRKRRKRFGSKYIIDNRLYAYWDEFESGERDRPQLVNYVSDKAFTPDAIRGTAEHLLGRWLERDAKILRYEANKRLLGDYPPLTLEGK